MPQRLPAAGHLTYLCSLVMIKYTIKMMLGSKGILPLANARKDRWIMNEEALMYSKYMKEALKQARKAGEIGEVPIGCVIVCEDRIIARGYNQRNKRKSTLAHAEILAIEKASRKLEDWRLEGCVMYVTLEPCPMCAGAIVQARIPKVVIGAMNPKAGCGGSILNILQERRFNHQVETVSGVCGQECQDMLQDFFRRLRDRKRNMP